MRPVKSDIRIRGTRRGRSGLAGVRIGAPMVLTSVPPVGPKNLETPRSDIDSMPKAVTASDAGAISILSASVKSSSSSSVLRFFVLPSERRGWGSFEDLAWMIASASSS